MSAGQGSGDRRAYLVALAVAAVLRVRDGRGTPPAATVVLPELLGLGERQNLGSGE